MRVLRNKGIGYSRINTEDIIKYKISVNLPNFSFKISGNDTSVDLAEKLYGIWMRRPLPPDYSEYIGETPVEPLQKYINNQWASLIEGLRILNNVLWINPQSSNRASENKILQLKTAIQLGLKIPKTCISSNKKDVLNFSDSCENGVIVKSLNHSLLEFPDKDFFIFTNNFNPGDKIPDYEFEISPSIFQEKLHPKKEYRVTIIGDACLTARIEYNDTSAIDWRTIRSGIGYSECKLPKDIEEKCIHLVKSLGLIFGAIDIIEFKNQYYFLEINPNGEWGWLQKKLNLPIAETIVDSFINWKKH